MTRLYKFIESCLPAGVFNSATWETMSEDIPGDVGIFLIESKNDIECIDGETLEESIKAQIMVNAFEGEDGIDQVSKYLRDFLDNIENTIINKDGLEIIRVRHLGPKASKAYVNGLGISVWRCEINIDYLLHN